MPEGPSIVILKELALPFKGKKVLDAHGSTTTIDKDAIIDHTVTDIKSWGKHLLICFNKSAVRIHLLMFGTYRINERKDAKPRLGLTFANGEINFYTCSVKWIENVETEYDWRVDIMSDKWDAKYARTQLKEKPDMLVCDALLNQDIFAGSGNIIKNEVLFKTKIHPLSTICGLPARKLTELINATSEYAFDFLKWKKEYVLAKHWQIYNRKMCPRCNLPVTRKVLGKTNRRTFYCDNCEVKYE